MGAIPFHHLERARGDREQWLGQAEEQRSQSGVAPPGGFRSVDRERDRDARDAGEIAEVVPVADDSEPFQRGRFGHEGRIVRPADQNLVVTKREGERAGRQRVWPGVTRSEAFGGVHGRSRSRRRSVDAAMPQ